jgi:acetyltransferase-like isoleucine patch superfamily enzyme
MILKFLKKLIRFYLFKIKYSQSFIAFGSIVDKKSTLGNNFFIYQNSSIYNSHIKDNVVISPYCSVFNCQIADYVKIYDHTTLSDCIIGRFSYIATGNSISQVKIGNFCSIGPECILGYGDHPTDFVSTSPVFFSTLKQCGISFSDQDYFKERKEIVVGHDVWIGARVFIRDGVTIGNGAVIAAGAVVVKDVPDYAIVGGVPAKIIRFRFPQEIIQKLQIMKWWDLSEEKLREAQSLIAQKDIQLFIRWYETKELTPPNCKSLN